MVRSHFTCLLLKMLIVYRSLRVLILDIYLTVWVCSVFHMLAVHGHSSYQSLGSWGLQDLFNHFPCQIGLVSDNRQMGAPGAACACSF